MVSLDLMSQKLEGVTAMPSASAILNPLLRFLEQPLEQLEVQRLVDLISADKSLTAQCLHMANSPLFGRWHNVETVRGAVVALGFGRVREITMSCAMMDLLPRGGKGPDPLVFWEHALGCALLSRRFARKMGFRAPDKAYLAGLLHDLGIIANLLLFPEEMTAAVQAATRRQIPLHEAEREVMGLTHCESGRMLGEHWNLSPELVEVARRHHAPETAELYRSLAAVVHISDLLCRQHGIGYGYPEAVSLNQAAPAIAVLREEYPSLQYFNWERLNSELDDYAREVRRLVGVLFRMK